MTEVLTTLRLEYVDGDTWTLLEPFAVASSVLGGRFDVGLPFTTDFNSTPRPLWPLFPPTEDGEAAVVHDKLYRDGTWNGTPITRALADQVHREFLIWKGAPAWKVTAMYRGLRWFGWRAWGRYRAQEGGVPAAVENAVKG